MDVCVRAKLTKEDKVRDKWKTEVRGWCSVLLTCVVDDNGSVGPLHSQACLKCCLSVFGVLYFWSDNLLRRLTIASTGASRDPRGKTKQCHNANLFNLLLWPVVAFKWRSCGVLYRRPMSVLFMALGFLQITCQSSSQLTSMGSSLHCIPRWCAGNICRSVP